MEMLGAELPGEFVDRVKGVCAQTFIQNPAEKSSDVSIVTVLREGIKKRLSILCSVLSVTPDLPPEKLCAEIVKCDESSFRDAGCMSKQGLKNFMLSCFWLNESRWVTWLKRSQEEKVKAGEAVGESQLYLKNQL